jgi:hypothetical protein
VLDSPLVVFAVGFNNFNGGFSFVHSGTSKLIVEQPASPIATNYLQIIISSLSRPFAYWLGKRSDPVMTLSNCQAMQQRIGRCSTMADIGAPVPIKGLRHPCGLADYHNAAEKILVTART